jgi:prepilin-type processing-associated H-X9-DG protein
MDADSGVYCPVSLGGWWRPQGDPVYYNSAKVWHGNRTATNVLFFDGHVEQKKYTDLLGNIDDVFGHY